MPMMVGIEAFKEAMAGHEGSYVLIGGGACSILFEETASNFRATNDLDIVVLAELDAAGFAQALWKFLDENGYKCWVATDGKARFYRFQLPGNSPNIGRCPTQIELFSRHPDFMLVMPDSVIAPLPFGEDLSSLSAIVLDDTYYAFIRDNVSMRKGVPLLEALHIIPLKMRAHIDLARRHASNLHVSERDLRKHRMDVFELAGLLTAEDKCELPEALKEDAKAFFADFEAYAARNTRAKDRERLMETLAFLRYVYL